MGPDSRPWLLALRYDAGATRAIAPTKHWLARLDLAGKLPTRASSFILLSSSDSAFLHVHALPEPQTLQDGRRAW